MATETERDTIFTARALDALPPVAVSPRLQLAVMAAYDAYQAERQSGAWSGLRAALRRFSDVIWPGAPVWAPHSLLAAALVIGVGIGFGLPYPASGERGVFSLDEPPSFSLTGAEQESL